MTDYTITLFDSKPELSLLRFVELKHHLWAEDYPHFFRSRASICAVENKGLYAVMLSEEPCPKAVCTNRDEPVYRDSCMELFFQPFADDLRYMNFEINPRGAYLSEVGTMRGDRKFIKEITETEPEVTVLPVENGWGVVLFIPEQLVSQVFGRAFSVAETEYIRANFYKCGEETDSPHFSSAFPVCTPAPDFHRPEYFEKLYIDTVRKELL